MADTQQTGGTLPRNRARNVTRNVQTGTTRAAAGGRSATRNRAGGLSGNPQHSIQYLKGLERGFAMAFAEIRGLRTGSHR